MSDLIKATVQTLDEMYHIDEETKKPSLGSLAADHYAAAGKSKKTKSVRDSIEKHYGKETADAVHHHTTHAYTTDETSGGKVPKHFHSNFIDKHLGGKDSAEHKAYKSRLEKHGLDGGSHQTEKHFNAHA